MNKITRVLLAAILCVTVTTGCFATVVQTHGPEFGPAKKQMNVTLLWGLKPSVVDASSCPQGVAEVVTGWPIWGVLVAFLTFLLIVPTNTAYVCAAE
jgi:hypothetical protein